MLEGKTRALAQHLVLEENVSKRDAIEFCLQLDNDYEIERVECPHLGSVQDISVFTEYEAETEYEKHIDCVIDDALDTLPSHLQIYFDVNQFEADYRINSCRAEGLSSYGSEYEYEIDGELFYIYKN